MISTHDDERTIKFTSNWMVFQYKIYSLNSSVISGCDAPKQDVNLQVVA